MKIIVLVKEVPDTYSERKLDLTTGHADRSASDAVIDEVCDRALELALSYADTNPGTEVTALTMAPEGASASVRKALAMGATSAIHVTSDQLIGADATLTGQVLGAAIARAGFDLVIAGNMSTDGSAGVVPAMIAETLRASYAGSLDSVRISADRVEGSRSTEGGTRQLEAPLPAVISVTEKLPEGRFATFKGIMAAKKKPYETVSPQELGIDPEDESVARSIIVSIAERPARAAGVIVVDEGDAADRLAEYLVQNHLV